MYYLLALLCVVIWGTTFVSTKVLIQHGVTPEEIIVMRYGIAYLCLLPFSRRWYAGSIKSELTMLALGLLGGTLYFMTENYAVKYTLTTNVSLITCTTPLITALLMAAFYRSERVTRTMLLGSILACVGVCFVVFNGHFMLRLNPLGDVLALCSALSWSLYSLLFMKVGRRFSTQFLTRKLFFYGIITTLPLSLAHGGFTVYTVYALMQPSVLFNILFLGLVASLGCFYLWGVSVKRIGTIAANNLIYFSPVFTLITAAIVLGEPVSWFSLLGLILTIGGVWLGRSK
ncbi:MAG: DMT family transporter [Bacteroidaceae bacterium]|nr:DMT family transporter [Bacteroidaceae bacterium]MBQ9176858.1 DMT family transporter [Bacteroidaceae bacterium]MBR1377672.1 DMT family transporter [Bacteroidaceae bacterium]